MAEVELKPLPPKEALRYFRAKTIGSRFAYDWRDMWAKEHGAAFVVAKGMRADVLKVLHSGLEQALSEGLTARDFAKQVRPLLEKKGWWGFKRVYDPVTGERIASELGTPRRLRTIYDVNLRTARAAGRWERIERRKKSRPYLQYVDAHDGRVRPEHSAMNGTLLPVDHPFWDTHYPPNGWRCRCIVRQLSKGDLKRRGLSVTNDKKIGLAGWDKTKSWKNERTGKTLQIPNGVDPGFGHNVGKSRLQALTPFPDGGPIGSNGGSNQLIPGGGALPLLPPRLVSTKRILPEDISHDDSINAFLGEFDKPVHIDPAQSPMLISQRLFVRDDGTYKSDKRIRKTHVLLMADTIKSPDEIWVEIVDVNGTLRLKRRAFARWEIPNPQSGKTGNISGMAVFEEQDNGVWRGATLFPVGRGSDTSQTNYILKNIRVGTLVYRRER